jgi:hypothetical protein
MTVVGRSCIPAASAGRTEKYQMATPPAVSTMAASSTNFQCSSRVRREIGTIRRAARIRTLSLR